DSHMVRMDRSIIDAALATVPPEVNLIARNPARNCRVGGRHVVFAPVSGPPAVSEQGKAKHSGTMADYRDWVRLSQHFDVVHVLGQMVEPQDAPTEFRHLETTFAQLTLGDKVPYF